jgi:hypothetical protein
MLDHAKVETQGAALAQRCSKCTVLNGTARSWHKGLQTGLGHIDTDSLLADFTNGTGLMRCTHLLALGQLGVVGAVVVALTSPTSSSQLWHVESSRCDTVFAGITRGL